MRRVVIIGGGISGLAAAHRCIELAEQHQPTEITILEAGPHLGGIIQTSERDGFLLEQGPDSFISEKPEALRLADRLGIHDRLIETNPDFRRSFIVREGRLRLVPEGFQLLAPSRFWPFVTTDIFSLFGKCRMAADLLLPRRHTNGARDESLASFVRRRLGEEALTRMAQPMVGGIYTADPELLSLRATLPRFLEMEEKHRSIILAMWRRGREESRRRDREASGARYSLFLSFDRGMRVLVDSLADKLSASENDRLHIKIRRQTRVDTIEPDIPERIWSVVTADGEILKADSVCVAVPAYIASRLIAKISNELASLLAEIKYASTATINLGYNRKDVMHPLDGFGFVVPVIENRSLLACTFSSVKFAGRAPEGKVLLRAFVGGALQADMLGLSDVEIIARVTADLEQLLGIKAEPLLVELRRWQNSMPQYHVNHLELVAKIDRELKQMPGLTLAGNSYRGAGISDCIRSGEAAAQVI
ncbi:MAG: protoporphyrinogen oxidase [Pyrinomonadaceae bacterium]